MQFLQRKVDNMLNEGPFFSALQDPKVSYNAKPQNWMSRLYSTIYQTSHLSYPFIILGNIATWHWLPVYAAIPVAAGMIFLGNLYLGYQQAERRKSRYIEQSGNITPPKLMHPMLKERTSHTFNHVFSFVKANGHFWYALRESQQKAPDWKLLYIDQLHLTKAQFKHSEMLADGENFMIRVPGKEEDTIYYKKVVEEDRKNDQFILNNLCEEPEAIDSWFTLPILNLLKPSQWGKRLTLNKNAKWAMTNAAEYKQKVIDDRGIIHANIPITTVYEYNDEIMSLHDPFVEKNSTYKLRLPSCFKEQQQFEASASIIFGCSSSKNTRYKRAKLCSMYLDYDSEGVNPLISFTFDVNDHAKRLLPINKLQKHQLPIGLTEISNLTVLQCNHDPHSIEIRIQSKKNSNGFFYKKIDAENWQYFDETTGSRSLVNVIKDQKSESRQVYQAQANFNIGGKRISKVIAYEFDPLCTFCSVVFEHEGKQSHLILRRHKNLVKSFLGIASESWSLNPDPQYSPTLLKVDDSIKVEIKQGEKDFQLISQDDRYKFAVHLKELLEKPHITSKERHPTLNLYHHKCSKKQVSGVNTNNPTKSNALRGHPF